MKTTMLALYILVSFPVLLLSTCAALENTSSSYADYESLAPAIDQGWLPEYFPASAVNIEERHNIDTNKVSATFNHDGSDIASLSIICRVVAKNSDGIKLLCPPFEHTISILVLKDDGSGYFQSEPIGI